MTVAVKKIDELKSHYQKTYSEDLFDIPRAPDFQCSRIDKLIKVIDSCYHSSNNTDRMDEDHLRSTLDDINSELHRLDDELEKVRSACEDIREWGNSWKEFAKKLIENEPVEIDRYI